MDTQTYDAEQAVVAWRSSNLPKGAGDCDKGMVLAAASHADEKPPGPKKTSPPLTIARQKPLKSSLEPVVASTEASKSRGVELGKASSFAERTRKYEDEAR